MKYDPELSLLHLAEPHPEVPALPTWCPNLHSPGLITGHRHVRNYNAGFHTRSQDFGPSVFGIHSGVLRVCGFGVDTIRYIVPEDWTFNSGIKLQRGVTGFAAHLLKWDSLCQSIAAEAVGEPSWLQVYLRTITGDQSSSNYWPRVFGSNVATGKMAWNISWQVQTRNHISLNGTSANIFFDAMQLTCAGQRFFSTEKGRIGMDPQQLAAGDKVYVLLQARPLFILRPCKTDDQGDGLSTKHSLLGHAYVHGLVRREALDLTNRDPDEVVSIC